MRRTLLLVLIVIIGFQMRAQFEDLSFGTDSTLDVVSWNIEHFPKNGQVTIDYVTQIVEALDADVIAIQEVSGEVWLDQLVENLVGWDGFYAYNQYVALAYIYKTDIITNPELFEIYTSKSREFPRAPLVMEMNYAGEDYVLINNHFKCCGDGYMNMDDPWDAETRRHDACILFDEYIVDFKPNSKVIILGDLNDILTDSPANNVFDVFTSAPESYMFVDMEIAEGSSSGWSYPTWPSHIDHILITDELFEEYANNGSLVETIRLDDYFSSWYGYDNNVSDHRPVGIKIKTDASLGVNEGIAKMGKLTNYPNPFSNTTTISFEATIGISEVVIYNMKHQQIKKFNVNDNQSSVIWHSNNDAAGVYYVKLIVAGEVRAMRKMIVMK